MPSKPIILDTSALAYRRAVVLSFREKFIPSRRVIISKSVCREIGRLRTSPFQDKRAIGHEAALAIIDLHSLPGLRVTMDSREPMAEHVDDDLLALAEVMQAQILTADGELKDRARARGIVCIDALELYRHLRHVAAEIDDIFPASDLKSGDMLTLRIIKLGQRPGQGIGYLEDGRMVVVEDGEPYLGGDVEVSIKSIRQTSPGLEMIFAITATQSVSSQLLQ
jgi:uncharacterized protein YacL